MKPIVVGVDDSEQATVALEWAIGYANAVGAPVLAVAAVDLPEIVGRAATLDELTVLEERRDMAERSLLRLVEEAGASHPPVQIHVKVDQGHPVDVLMSASDDAEILVVGAHGIGGFRRTVLGSVSTGVIHHARCPVAVVHGLALTRGGQVVVGVDGSDEAHEALVWATDYVRRTGATLTIVGAWDWPSFQEVPVLYGTFDPRGAMKETVEAAALSTGLPDAQLRTVAAKGPAANVILDNAEGAELVVVGSRGRGGFTGMLLGSVSSRCVHHATCPVVVVRP